MGKKNTRRVSKTFTEAYNDVTKIIGRDNFREFVNMA
jgi:hypothetical protein